MVKKMFLVMALFGAPLKANLSRECLLDMCLTNRIQYVDYSFTDFLGNRKSIIRPIEYLENDLDFGISFDGSSIPGCTRITKSDMLLMPDVESPVRKLPWTYDHTSMVRVMCTMHTDVATPYCGDPRALLKRQLDELHEMGYDFFVGPELEFYAFNDSKKSNHEPIDTGTYADGINHIGLENSLVTIVHVLNQLDLHVERLMHEVGDGQYEVSLKYDNALRIADALITAKHSISVLFKNYNKLVSFMPKPLTGKPGSGMHINFSLYDLDRSCNAFYDATDDHHLSALGRSFIAGVLKHLAEITLLMNPTVNSYKRLGGHEAPKYICCGDRNRSALIRLPQTTRAELVRAELRSPDALCNPYLVFAAILKAGMEGMKHGYPLPEIIEENLYTMDELSIRTKNIHLIPQTMHDALAAFQASDFLRELLGPVLFTNIYEAKKAELDDFNYTVTDWERAHYTTY